MGLREALILDEELLQREEEDGERRESEEAYRANAGEAAMEDGY
jgi:hypothetical protein